MDEISPTFENKNPMSPARVEEHRWVGQAATHFEAVLLDLPEGRERSLALMKLEEAAMWANKALSRAPEHPDA